jgi:hypothetical protein
MKVQFAARVIGQELVESETPKSDDGSMKVKLAVRPVGQVAGKSSTATLTMPEEQAHREFPLKRLLLITIEEGQKELWDAVAGEDRPVRTKDPRQGEIGLPVGDSPIARPPLAELGIVPGRRGGKKGRDGASTAH